MALESNLALTPGSDNHTIIIVGCNETPSLKKINRGPHGSLVLKFPSKRLLGWVWWYPFKKLRQGNHCLRLAWYKSEALSQTKTKEINRNKECSSVPPKPGLFPGRQCVDRKGTGLGSVRLLAHLSFTCTGYKGSHYISVFQFPHCSWFLTIGSLIFPP